MRVKTALVTGSSGLIGSEVSDMLMAFGWRVVGWDSNARGFYFGSEGSTAARSRYMDRKLGFRFESIDVRNRDAVLIGVRELKPDAIIHTAAQPSHDYSARVPLIDFDTNVAGTISLLEAARGACPESPFIFFSTSKVYGDIMNHWPKMEFEKRYVFTQGCGVNENCSIDKSLHSPFGAGKAGADLYAQEYGRYYGMPVTVLRPGCLTGSRHNSVELHGFLSYLVKCALGGMTYRIFGYKGKQVRDNIHSYDIATACMEILNDPPEPGEVFNIGGEYKNSISILEALERFPGMSIQYIEEARRGDHVVYYTDMSKFKRRYPVWGRDYDLDAIFDDIERGYRDPS